MREEGAAVRVQMEIMHWLHEENSGTYFQHTLKNVALFVPVGFLFSLLPRERCRMVIPAASFGLLLSVIIETVQFFFRFGICDIDDIFANFAGAAIGAVFVAAWERKALRGTLNSKNGGNLSKMNESGKKRL